MGTPFTHFPMKSSPQDDTRMREIQQKMHTVGTGLAGMHAYVDKQSGMDREDARRALRSAFETGCTFSELNLLPPEPPIGPDGHLKLGAALKKHVLQARAVYAEMGILRDHISDLLELKNDSAELLGLLRNDDTTTETSSTALAA